MRKLTQDEYDILIRIAAFGRYGSVTMENVTREPQLQKVMHGLVRKKRLVAEEIDGNVRYEMTQQGWDDAS